MHEKPRVLVTGGAGYVGAVLVPKLLAAGYRSRVIDLYLYGEDVFDSFKSNPDLEEIKGDIRDTALVEKAVLGCDMVIHLACISNDPSFDLNPELGKSINLDCFAPLVRASKAASIKRFIYASSSSVYGISDAPSVTEAHVLDPMTDYSRFKADCETILLAEESEDFTTTIIRPATVCGASPRQRLDLTVNILTTHAFVNHRIKVFGGSQKRPNIHIEDMTDLYLLLLKLPKGQIAGKIYNAGYQNHTIAEIAEMVASVIQEESREERVEIVTTPTDDLRSYHISSDKIRDELGFEPVHSIADAVRDLVPKFSSGALTDPLNNINYYNVKLMNKIGLR